MDGIIIDIIIIVIIIKHHVDDVSSYDMMRKEEAIDCACLRVYPYQ